MGLKPKLSSTQIKRNLRCPGEYENKIFEVSLKVLQAYQVSKTLKCNYEDGSKWNNLSLDGLSGSSCRKMF